jgi:Tol biopolymer transport system component
MVAMRVLRCIGLAVGATLCVAPAAPAASNGPIVFERDGRLLVVNVPGATARPLTSGRADHAPAVSPDGRRIAFVRGRDLWTMSADGRSARALTRDGRFHTDPTWTPNGKTIIFSSGAWGGVDLASIPAAGGGPIRRLTSTTGHEERHPDVSPDGTRVVFDRTGCETPRGGGHCVYVMPVGGGGGAPVNLTPETVQAGCESRPGFAIHGAARQPAWSPDGNRITFVGPTACDVSHLGSDIWTMSASGGGKVNLTRDAATDDTAPSWSPDAATLLFTREGTDIMALPPASGGAASPVARGMDATWSVRRASP